MRHFGLKTLIPLALCTTAACEPTNLYVAHHTVVGVNAAVNTEQTKGHLIIGYDRNFVTLVPKSVDDPDGEGKEAMSALSCSELKVEGIFLTKFVEYLATGEAGREFARKFAMEPEEGSKIFDCYDDN